MHCYLETDVLVSALLSQHGAPALLLDAWIDKAFKLVTSETQIEEITLISLCPMVKALITPAQAERFIEDLQRCAYILEQIPDVEELDYSDHEFLMGVAPMMGVDHWVMADKKALTFRERHGSTFILTASEMLTLLNVARPPADSVESSFSAAP